MYVFFAATISSAVIFIQTKPKEKRWLDYDFEKKLEEISPVNPMPVKANIKWGVLPCSVPG